MRRLIAAAALGLALPAAVCVPAAIAAESSPTTTPASPATTTTLTADATTTAPTTTTSSTSPTTTTAARPTGQPVARALAAPTATVTIATSGSNCSMFCFSPAATTIDAGGTVTFTNPTTVAHTVKRCTPAECSGAAAGTGTDAQFSSTAFALGPSGSFTYTFPQPGTYVYYCSLHGYALMHGTITVTAAAPATTTPITDPGAPPPPPATTATDPNALASTGGSPDPLITIAALFLVVGLAAIGLSARGRREHKP